jgi:hypothetical protein
MERMLGPSHLVLGPSLHNLALTLEYQDKWEEAALYERRALAVFEANAPADGRTATMKASLAYQLWKLGRTQEATRLWNEAVTDLPTTDASLETMTRGRLLETLLLQGTPGKALRFAQETVALAEKSLPPGHGQRAVAHFELARAELDSGLHRQALASVERSLPVLLPGVPDPAHRALIHFTYARALAANNRRAQALAEAAVAEKWVTPLTWKRELRSELKRWRAKQRR